MQGFVILDSPFYLDDPIFQASLIRESDQVKDSASNSPVLKLFVVWNVSPCSSVEFQ